MRYLEIKNPDNKSQTLFVKGNHALAEELSASGIQFEHRDELPPGVEPLDGIAPDNYQDVMTDYFQSLNAISAQVVAPNPEQAAAQSNTENVEPVESVSSEKEDRFAQSRDELLPDEEQSKASIEEAYYVNQEFLTSTLHGVQKPSVR